MPAQFTIGGLDSSSIVSLGTCNGMLRQYAHALDKDHQHVQTRLPGKEREVEIMGLD